MPSGAKSPPSSFRRSIKGGAMPRLARSSPVTIDYDSPEGTPEGSGDSRDGALTPRGRLEDAYRGRRPRRGNQRGLGDLPPLDVQPPALRIGEPEALPATLLQDFAQFAPPAVAARAARVIARATVSEWIDPPFNVVISNVPGPQFPLYCVGSKLVANYPVSAINDGVGLNITVQSYNGNLDFGMIACRELLPDLWDLMENLPIRQFSSNRQLKLPLRKLRHLE